MASKSLLSLVLACTLVLAGCAGSVGVGTETPSPGEPTATQPDPTSRPIPEAPTDLSNASVRQFVVAHEEAFVNNENLDADRVEVSCRVRWAEETDDRYRVGVFCGVSTYEYRDGEPFSVGDGFSRATYVVNGTEWERMDGFVDPPATETTTGQTES
ncbi:hypothetical protein [Haloarchaeobius sp. TZWWS8]|uniref:hypothetical protein n=1 Tax=Haloarchaeobius sp. TZWWS8 TaxID=3446121 RepID=UPI003EBCFC16